MSICMHGPKAETANVSRLRTGIEHQIRVSRVVSDEGYQVC